MSFNDKNHPVQEREEGTATFFGAVEVDRMPVDHFLVAQDGDRWQYRMFQANIEAGRFVVAGEITRTADIARAAEQEGP